MSFPPSFLHSPRALLPSALGVLFAPSRQRSVGCKQLCRKTLRGREALYNERQPPARASGPHVSTYGVCLHFPAGPKDPTLTDGTSHAAVWSCCALEHDPTFHISPPAGWVVQAPVCGALPTADAWLLGRRQSSHVCGNRAGKMRRQGGLSKWVHWELRAKRASRGLKAT